MIQENHSPVLLVVSAPSGAGKTTLCDRLLREDCGIRYSVSCTTRSPRADEVNGKDYHFLSSDEFASHVEAGNFLEWAEVHGSLYGTLKEHVYQIASEGFDVLMDLDVQGARAIRDQMDSMRLADEEPMRYADVFIAPPSLNVLETRLRSRGLDTDDSVTLRLKNAQTEMEEYADFQYLVVNDRIDDAYKILLSILIAERHRQCSLPGSQKV